MGQNHSLCTQKAAISGEISKAILGAIQRQQDVEVTVLANVGLSQAAFLSLQAEYAEIRKLKYPHQFFPRNLIFYEMIQKRVPAFSWQVREHHVDMTRPKLNKRDVSLLSLLTQKLDFDAPTSLRTQYPMLAHLPESQDSIIAELLANLQIIYPDRAMMKQVIAWLDRGLLGEPLSVFSLVCPDYSVEPTGNVYHSFKHTFKEVGGGIGLVAKRILDALPLIDCAFKQLGVNFTAIVAMADYESLSEANLKNLGVSSRTFLSRLESSRKAFVNYSKVPIQAVNILELCGGETRWLALCSDFQKAFAERKFGATVLSEKTLLEMVKARKSLYSRWYGPKQHDSEYLDILLNQAAEYAVVGKIVLEHYPNALVLGADHSVFGPFLNVPAPLPVLYLKRFYL